MNWRVQVVDRRWKMPLPADSGLFAFISRQTRGQLCPMAGGGFTIARSKQCQLKPEYVLGLLNSNLLFRRFPKPEPAAPGIQEQAATPAQVLKKETPDCRQEEERAGEDGRYLTQTCRDSGCLSGRGHVSRGDATRAPQLTPLAATSASSPGRCRVRR